MGGPYRANRAPRFQAERSERQQARILEALTDGPKSIAQISKIIHLTQPNVHTHMVRLMKKPQRRVFIGGYELCEKRYRFLYEIGNKPNVTVAAFQMERILSHLDAINRPCSAIRIAAGTNLGYSTAARYIQMLMKSEQIHIGGWVWPGNAPAALYMYGKGENVPRPRKKPSAKVKSSIFAALGV